MVSQKCAISDGKGHSCKLLTAGPGRLHHDRHELMVESGEAAFSPSTRGNLIMNKEVSILCVTRQVAMLLIYSREPDIWMLSVRSTTA